MSKPVFLVMPEWQGSPSARAMQLAEGAEILREDLPPAATREVAVPLEAGDAMGTPVARLSSVLRARDAAREVLAGVSGRTPILLGGDCASSLPGVEHAARGADRLAVLWFDAHADLQHPSTSPSGAASGMTLRHALGDGCPDLVAEPPLDPALTALVGARELDPEEQTELERLGLPVISADGDPEEFGERIAEHLRGLDATALYIHIDLDVLDPAEFASVHAAIPFGLGIAHLTAGVRGAVAAVPLAGAAICEFAPADPAAAADDLPTVLRILAALTSGPRAEAAA